MQPKPNSGVRAASTLSLALTCAGCLVTNELDFDPRRSLVTVIGVSPRSPYPVPSAPDDECLPVDAINLVARYYSEDVEDTLFVLASANDDFVFSSTFRAPPNPEGGPEHLAPRICMPRDKLTNPCNVVELFVSNEEDRLRVVDIDEVRRDPTVQRFTWYLYGTSRDNPGGAAMPYVSFSECLSGDP